MVALNGQGATRGKTARLGIEAACNQSLAAVCSHPGTDQGFLFQVLSSMYEGLRRLTGDGRSGLNLGLIRSISILVPPLEQQRAIAAVLDAIDEAIERTEEVISATERLRDALLHELLTRGVPGWHTEWRHVPGLGTIPADWGVSQLGNGALHVGSGVTPRGGKSSYTTTGVKLLRSQNVHFRGLRLQDVAFIDLDTDYSMRRSRVYPGDVLLNITGASIGRCTVAPPDLGPANVNQHVCIIRLSDEFNPTYICEWLTTPRSQKEIDDIQMGQSRQGLNYQQVRSLRIAQPTRTEQDRIAHIIASVRAVDRDANDYLQGLRSMKVTVSDALLTGQVRVATKNRKN